MIPRQLRASRRHRGLRTLLAGATVLVGGVLAGCAPGLLLHHGGPSVSPSRVVSSTKSTPLADARDATAQNPGDPYVQQRLAERYAAMDSLAAAESAARTALARDSTYAPSLALLSKLLFEAGRHAEAVTMLERALTRTEAFSAEEQQVLREGLALHEDALGHLERTRAALTGWPSEAGKETRSTSIYLALRGETPESADAEAERAAKKTPESAVDQNNFGITRLRAGDPAGARAAFLTAVARDPKLPGPYYNLAILEKFFALDDVAAARWYSRYRERAQSDPDSLGGVFAADARKTPAGKGN